MLLRIYLIINENNFYLQRVCPVCFSRFLGVTVVSHGAHRALATIVAIIRGAGRGGLLQEQCGVDHDAVEDDTPVYVWSAGPAGHAG